MSMNDPELSRLSNKAIYGNYLEVHRRRQQLVWIFFWESCGECESGGFVKNILADVTAVRVGVEYDGFTPDICLDRNNKPPVWIEFSPPMVEKVAYCAARAAVGENSMTMTTTLTRPETEYSQMAGGRKCEGCPRCKDAANAGFCKKIHKPEFGNLHPVCRRCGHCVLRGQHNDDTSDLEQDRHQG